MSRKGTKLLSVIVALIVLAGIAVGLYFVTDRFTNWHLNVDCIAGNHNPDENGLCVSCKRQFATKIELFIDGKECDGEVTNNNFGLQSVTYELSGKVLPENALQKEITWSSDNTEVATVDKDGMVTIVGKGEATVTAKLKNGVFATCKFIIDDSGCPEYLVFEQDELYFPSEYLESEMLRSQTCRIYREGSDDYHCDLVWTSSNESVALVSLSPQRYSSYVLLRGEGTATISATAPNGVSATATVYVGPRLELSMPEIEYDPATVEAGDTFQIGHKWLPSQLVSDRIHHWSSTNESVATIDRDTGLVTIVGEGDVTFRAYTSKNIVGAEITITVEFHVPKAIELYCDLIGENPIVSDDRISLSTNGIGSQTESYPTSTQIRVVVLPAHAPQTVTWTNSDPTVAMIDEQGNVTALNKGVAIIRATTENGIYTTCVVRVMSFSDSIQLAQQAPIEILSGNSTQLTAILSPSTDDTFTLPTEVTWSSADINIATVDQNGMVTGISYGETTISASILGSDTPATVKVRVDWRVPQSLSIIGHDESDNIEDVTSFSLFTNVQPNSKQLSVQVRPSAAAQEAQWASSDDAVATVDENGNVTAVGNGTATITAMAANGVSATCTVYVNTKVEQIQINEESPMQVGVGDSVTLTASVLPENANWYDEIVWKTSNPSVATVAENGVVTALSGGEVQITAYPHKLPGLLDHSISDTITIVVIDVENMALKLIPEGDENIFDLTYSADGETLNYKYGVAFEATAPFALSITPSTAHVENITYTNSNPDVVYLDKANHQIKCKALGKATITATAPNGVTASMEILCTGTRGTDLFKDNLNLTLGETVSPFTDVAQQIVLDEYIRAGRVGNYEQIVGDGCWFNYSYDSNYISVDSATGNITALAASETTLRITVYDFIWRNDIEVLTTVEIPITISEIPTSLQAATWSQIQSMAADGTLAQHFNVGDEKTVTLNNGQVLTFVILDFNHDADNSATFGLKGLYGTSAMNTTNSNTANAAMAATLAEVYDLLPDDLKGIIRTVDKTTTAGGKSRTIKTTQEQLFLFSEIEVTGVATGTFSGEGTQYAWFTNANNRIKDGKWLLRSPAKDSYTMFRAIYETGNVGGINANVESGVCFGFCV